MITIKEPYADAIRRGEKKFEIRKRIPKSLAKGDTILVCVGRNGGYVEFSFRVSSVVSMPLMHFWSEYGRMLCISWNNFWEYAGGRQVIYALGIECVEEMGHISVEDFGVSRPPQSFAKVNV